MFIEKWLISLLIVFTVLAGCGTVTVEDELTDAPSADNASEKTMPQENEKPAETQEDGNFSTATVSRVVDGDTVNIELDGQEETVRLLLVDTPETKHPKLPVQPFGQEASDFAVEKLTGKDIQIEFDGPERDNYDRLLGYIWVDGDNFNQLLVEKGLARYAYVYDPPYTHQDEMKQAEQQAREAGIGIWSIDGYVTEDGFNHEDVEDDPDEDIHYANCTEARDAGVTPLYEGDPGYNSDMDRDGDGIACE
ncbi:micrococcal nuclease [Gracilibacillus orientalis]|uniref:Micrococcal nuclease n=1 Tax=Gracilibacillus orientalis TaxID=334253 RepID=A0A1I4GX96_9BACI|nr:thermonuclease family protein [Gracilibacillus orientalis]SFL34579.1 micrococcal nuclease [Gracilibacillus orientalis]